MSPALIPPYAQQPIKMTARQEAFSKELFLLMVEESCKLNAIDLLILKSAAAGKLAFEEMPDGLRKVFCLIAIRASEAVAKP